MRLKRRRSYKQSVEFQRKILKQLGGNLRRGARIVACQHCRSLIAQIVVYDNDEFIFPHLDIIAILNAYTPNETWLVGGKAFLRHEVTAELLYRYIQQVKKCDCELIPASETVETFSDDEIDDTIRRLFPENLTIVDVDAIVLDENSKLSAVLEFCLQSEKTKVVWVTRAVADYFEVPAYLVVVDKFGRLCKIEKITQDYIVLGGVNNGNKV